MSSRVVDVFEKGNVKMMEIKAPEAEGEVPDCVEKALECINTVEPSKRLFQLLLNALEKKSHELFNEESNDANKAFLGVMDLAAGYTNTASFRRGELYPFDYGRARKYLDRRLLQYD